MFQNFLFIISFALVIFIVFHILLHQKKYKGFSYYFVLCAVLFLVITIILYPGESVDAAYNGLITWATLVIPALLPFFIGSELLINLGIVKFLGVLLEPIMRPIFNVPGEAALCLCNERYIGLPCRG